MPPPHPGGRRAHPPATRPAGRAGAGRSAPASAGWPEPAPPGCAPPPRASPSARPGSAAHARLSFDHPIVTRSPGAIPPPRDARVLCDARAPCAAPLGKKILVEKGLAVDPVHDNTPNSPSVPKQPRKSLVTRTGERQGRTDEANETSEASGWPGQRRAGRGGRLAAFAGRGRVGAGDRVLFKPGGRGGGGRRVSWTRIALVWVSSCTAWMPSSRPRPERPSPPNGTSGPTTR